MFSGTLFFKESFYLFRCINIGFMIIYILIKDIISPFSIIYTYLMTIAFLIFFYRIPIIYLSPEVKRNNTIISPCQGRVMRILDLGNEYQICIFLNIFDVHLQYYPINGIVSNIEYIEGRFHPAYMFEKSMYNERFITTIKTINNHNIKVVQIAGQIARRIVNNSMVGDIVNKGDYMGMIKLPSRVDLFIPKQKFILLVKQGDYIKPCLEIAHGI